MKGKTTRIKLEYQQPDLEQEALVKLNDGSDECKTCRERVLERGHMIGHVRCDTGEKPFYCFQLFPEV